MASFMFPAHVVLSEKIVLFPFCISQGYFYCKQQKAMLVDSSKIRNFTGRPLGVLRKLKVNGVRRAGARLL